MDKERSAEIKKGETAVPGREAENANIIISVVVIVPVVVVDAILIGRRRTRRRALFAQALTDPPPFERLRGSHG